MARTPMGELKILSGAMHEVFFETLDIKEIILGRLINF